MDKIKVSIVEDDPQWVSLMTDFINLQEDMTVVWTAYTRQEAVEQANAQKTDIIIMDINLTENKCDGIYAALEILEQTNSMKVIMLTSLKEEEIIRGAFNAGAVNYINKENYQSIPSAIRATFHNNSPIESILKDYLRLKQEQALQDLTPAEKEIYHLIAQGYSRSEIEKITLKTKNTVKSQIKSIYLKLDASNSREAVQEVKRGWLKRLLGHL